MRSELHGTYLVEIDIRSKLWVFLNIIQEHFDVLVAALLLHLLVLPCVDVVLSLFFDAKVFELPDALFLGLSDLWEAFSDNHDVR